VHEEDRQQGGGEGNGGSEDAHAAPTVLCSFYCRDESSTNGTTVFRGGELFDLEPLELLQAVEGDLISMGGECAHDDEGCFKMRIVSQQQRPFAVCLSDEHAGAVKSSDCSTKNTVVSSIEVQKEQQSVDVVSGAIARAARAAQMAGRSAVLYAVASLSTSAAAVAASVGATGLSKPSSSSTILGSFEESVMLIGVGQKHQLLSALGGGERSMPGGQDLACAKVYEEQLKNMASRMERRLKRRMERMKARVRASVQRKVKEKVERRRELWGAKRAKKAVAKVRERLKGTAVDLLEKEREQARQLQRQLQQQVEVLAVEVAAMHTQLAEMGQSLQAESTKAAHWRQRAQENADEKNIVCGELTRTLVATQMELGMLRAANSSASPVVSTALLSESVSSGDAQGRMPPNNPASSSTSSAPTRGWDQTLAGDGAETEGGSGHTKGGSGSDSGDDYTLPPS
jgi:hypothetical protein